MRPKTDSAILWNYPYRTIGISPEITSNIQVMLEHKFCVEDYRSDLTYGYIFLASFYEGKM